MTPVANARMYGAMPELKAAWRADAPYRALEDTFEGVVGFALADSYSGCVALRAPPLPYREARGTPHCREARGGFVDARQIIEALDDGRIDVGPLDSHYFDLLRVNDPDCAAKVRFAGSTDAAPIPALVATAALDSVLAKSRNFPDPW